MAKEFWHERMAHVRDETVSKILDKGHYDMRYKDERLRCACEVCQLL